LRRKPIPTHSAGRGEEILTPSGRTGTGDRAPPWRARSTNKPFAEWNEVFPDSSSFTALANRLLRRAGIVKIEGDFYRAKEAKERAARSRKEKAPRRNAVQT